MNEPTITSSSSSFLVSFLFCSGEHFKGVFVRFLPHDVLEICSNSPLAHEPFHFCARDVSRSPHASLALSLREEAQQM
jgi:hypothetical protein